MIVPLLFIPSAYGEIEKGKNFDRELLSVNPDGSKTYKWNSHYERIATWEGYVDYVKSEDADSITVETMAGSVILDKNTCNFSYYTKGYIDEGELALFSDGITPLQSTDAVSWSEVTQLINAVCVAEWDEASMTLKSIKSTPIGIMEYRYIFTGEVWKTELYVKNTSGLNDRYFGFVQTIDLNRDTIHYGGSQKNLDNFNGTTYERQWLENNESKVIDFLNGQRFDFDISFENLDSVYIQDTGIQGSRLSFSFTHDTEILPDGAELILDPTFGPDNNPTVDGQILDDGNDDVCNGDSLTKDTTSTIANVFTWDTGEVNDCTRAFFEYDISSIPTSNIEVSSASFKFEVGSVSASPRTCDFVGMDSRPSTASNADIFSSITSDTVMVSNDAVCQTAGNNKNVDLTATGYTYIENSASRGWMAIGMKNNDEVQDGTNHRTNIQTEEDGTATPKPTLEFEYAEINRKPNAVTDLTASGETFSSVDLAWSTPTTQNNGNITGYMINYTTPHGDPLTQVTNDTESILTQYTVTGLTVATDYSFRVSAWTEGGTNGSGNIANTTTLGSAVSAGNFTINGTNPNTIQMLFERDDVNSTHTWVNVTYPDTFSLECDLSYKFGMINRTYTNLDNTTLNANFVESSFLFINQTNDIVSFYCFDQLTGYDGRYVVQWSDFPLIDQLANFQNGTYGTQGMIGALDLITVMAVLVSMIGFNRNNQAVGVIFSVSLISALAYFEIIQLETIIFGALAIAIVLGVTNARKD